tara:strand:+ start:793 stop:1509 length:717 start_codon:yes stop_codon:yes gene_type:complete
MRTFRELHEHFPETLRFRVMSQWKAKQNPKWHPEGNSLKHIIVVTERAMAHFPFDIDIQLSAYFHDLGKLDCYDISKKTGQPTAYGHENVSEKLVFTYYPWIEELGGNVDKIAWIVKNHMRVKFINNMTASKRNKLMEHEWYDDLAAFNVIDTGGVFNFNDDFILMQMWRGSDPLLRRFIGNRVSIRQQDGRELIGVVDFIGKNHTLDIEQVNISNAPYRNVQFDTIKLCPRVEPIFN